MKKYHSTAYISSKEESKFTKFRRSMLDCNVRSETVSFLNELKRHGVARGLDYTVIASDDRRQAALTSSAKW